MADISRDQFDEDLLVEKKYFQQNKYLLDDEANVIQDIPRYRLKRLLSYLVESGDARFGVGFSVVDHADANKVTVKAGACAAHLTDTKAAVRCDLIWQDADVNIDGWTTPSGSDRTDYLYLDIYEDEIDPTEDPNLINPSRGEETTRDLRLIWSVQKSQGSAPGTPPAGHTYVTIAQIARYNGVAQIQPADITNLLPDHFAYLRQDGSKDLEGNLTVASGVTIDGTDVSETLLRDGSRSLTGNLAVDSAITIDGVDISAFKLAYDSLVTEYNGIRDNYREVLFIMVNKAAHDTAGAVSGSYLFTETNAVAQLKAYIPYYKIPNAKKIRFKFKVFSSAGGNGTVELEIRRTSGTVLVGSDSFVGTSGTDELIVDISGVAADTDLDVNIKMSTAGTSIKIEDGVCWASYT